MPLTKKETKMLNNKSAINYSGVNIPGWKDPTKKTKSPGKYFAKDMFIPKFNPTTKKTTAIPATKKTKSPGKYEDMLIPKFKHSAKKSDNYSATPIKIPKFKQSLKDNSGPLVLPPKVKVAAKTKATEAKAVVAAKKKTKTAQKPQPKPASRGLFDEITSFNNKLKHQPRKSSKKPEQNSNISKALLKRRRDIHPNNNIHQPHIFNLSGIVGVGAKKGLTKVGVSQLPAKRGHRSFLNELKKTKNTTYLKKTNTNRKPVRTKSTGPSNKIMDMINKAGRNGNTTNSNPNLAFLQNWK
jgi:hypothetical protein